VKKKSRNLEKNPNSYVDSRGTEAYVTRINWNLALRISLEQSEWITWLAQKSYIAATASATSVFPSGSLGRSSVPFERKK
jgi:hypothetical protein